MVTRVVRHRAEIDGAREVRAIAATLGGQARDARRIRRRTIASVAKAIGISTARLSEIERGLGLGAPLTTWVALGIAIGRPLAIRFSAPLVIDRSAPADAGHLEIQEFLLGLARANGRLGTFELPTRPS